jgi:hypothetical protein
MSSLSHEYVSSAEFSRCMNAAVLRVKKQFVRGQTTGGDGGELQTELALLRKTFSALLARLDESAADATIPEDIFKRIVEDNRGSLKHFQDTLHQVLATLDGKATIQHHELEFLDALCAVADASASTTYRKLWRR